MPLLSELELLVVFCCVKLGAIDIGSNAIRLLISRIIPGKDQPVFKKVEFVRVPLRLGDDVFGSGKISDEKEELLFKTIQSFKLLLDIHQVKAFRACATSAMRESRNGEKIAKRIEKKLGIHIDIINGKEESDLILSSVLNYFPENGNYLNIDVGGGSTEMTVIDNHVPTKSKSFNIGTVRLLEGRVKTPVWDEMEHWVKKHTHEMGHLTGIGTGGNINKLYRLVKPEPDMPMSLEELRKVYVVISNLSLKERIYKLKLNPDRADVIVPAARIYLNVMEWGGIDRIYAPNAGLKDGILISLAKEYLSELQ